MDDTLFMSPVMVLFTCSVFMEMLFTLMSVAKRFVRICATSTAMEMALPLAFKVTPSLPF